MLIGGPYDPRSIANLLLDTAESNENFLTNLSMQKLLYFSHSLYLVRTKSPLVTGYFEAWKYGPVHPAVYNSFKKFGDNFITGRAAKTNILTGLPEPIQPPDDDLARRAVQHVMHSYGQLTPGRLVDISHAKDAPWHFVVSKVRTSVAFGMRIPDSVILERFKHHKVTLGAESRHGEPGEESPYHRN